jgi:UDP-N-acetylglucosamine acyltransferase
LRAAFRFIFHGEGTLSDRARDAGTRWSTPEVSEVVAFILADAKRPICMPPKGRLAFAGEDD